MSTIKPKVPTTRGVSAALRKAGFEKSESGASRVRGWHIHSEGFTVEDRGTGKVRVRHIISQHRGADADAAYTQQQEAVYTEALREAGFGTERDEWGELLVVTAKETAQ